MNAIREPSTMMVSAAFDVDNGWGGSIGTVEAVNGKPCSTR